MKKYKPKALTQLPRKDLYGKNWKINKQKPLDFHRKSEIARVLLQTFNNVRVYFLCVVRL